jgi:hypothetical protein
MLLAEELQPFVSLLTIVVIRASRTPRSRRIPCGTLDKASTYPADDYCIVKTAFADYFE